MATKYENYITGGDTPSLIYGSTWQAQSFTPSISHTITSVKLLLYKAGTIGTLTVGIRATDGDGKPTGADLASGTSDGSTLTTDTAGEWREITLTVPYALTAGIKYAIVIRLSGGNESNRAHWIRDDTAATYAGGEHLASTDTGVTWSISGSGVADKMFEEWGMAGSAASSVTTQATTAIDKTTATGNGNVTSLGTPAATQYGHCWATFPNPTTSNSKAEKGVPAATGAYTSAMTGLLVNTFYYVRAYITNLVGTFYGAEVQFTTLADVPAVTTKLVSYIAALSALGNGSIDNNGGSPVTQHGVCWSVNANPTTADSKTEDGATSVIGSFSSNMLTGLVAATLYHVRAYATNSTGAGYGADVTFTTLAIGAPTVATDAITNIQSTNATGNGAIIGIGESAVTEHGHCWGTSVNPTTADSKTTKGAGVVGAFTSAITGLTAGAAYHTRAYATNSYGTAYGNNIAFQLFGEGAGVIIIQDELFWYLSKSGTKRYIKGTESA